MAGPESFQPEASVKSFRSPWAGSAADAGGCAEVTAGQNRKARRGNKSSFYRTERSGIRFGGRPQGGPALLALLPRFRVTEKARTRCVGVRAFRSTGCEPVSGLFGWWGGRAPFGSVADPLGYLEAVAFVQRDRCPCCGPGYLWSACGGALHGGGHRGPSCSFWFSVSSVCAGDASARHNARVATARRTSRSVRVMSGESVTGV
jgi:hypothetical protein